MKHADRFALRIDEDDRQAIRRLNSQQQARGRRDQPVAGERRMRNRVHAMDDVGMNLPHGDERPACRAVELRSTGQPRAAVPTRSDRPQKRRPVAFDSGPGIVFREAEIEVAFAIGAGKTARACGGSVYKPRQRIQMTRAKNVQLFFLGSPGQHMSMLTEAADVERFARRTSSPL